MCRFYHCSLSKDELSKQCNYKQNNENKDVPWTEETNDIDYEPMDFVEPKQCKGLPVIINGEHIKSLHSRIFVPMHWTLIPPWFSDTQDWSATTYNARIENLTLSKIYNSCLNDGKRCIVVMEGFYEIKKKTSSEEVFYLKSFNKSLLKAAGLFSILKKKNGKQLCTCTIVTTQADKNMSKIHSRMPLLLKNDEDVEAWLNYKSVKIEDAITLIQKKGHQDLDTFQVNKVGSTKPLKNSSAGSKNLMANWLSISRKRKASEDIS